MHQEVMSTTEAIHEAQAFLAPDNEPVNFASQLLKKTIPPKEVVAIIMRVWDMNFRGATMTVFRSLQLDMTSSTVLSRDVVAAKNYMENSTPLETLKHMMTTKGFNFKNAALITLAAIYRSLPGRAFTA